MTATLAGYRPVAKKKPTASTPPRDRIDLRADPEWTARVQAQADRLGIALSAYIRMAVSERLERDEDRPRGTGTNTGEK
jgi:hypothetical protein